MKRFIYLLLLTLACCSGEKKPENLFVIQARSGKVEKVDNVYYFEMNDVQSKMVTFTDRPYRDASFIEMRDFIKIWDKGEDNFKSDPPNASVSAILSDSENGEQVIHIIELDDPQYNEKEASLRFKVESIHSGLPLQEVKIEKVTLFIDDYFFMGNRGE